MWSYADGSGQAQCRSTAECGFRSRSEEVLSEPLSAAHFPCGRVPNGTSLQVLHASPLHVIDNSRRDARQKLSLDMGYESRVHMECSSIHARPELGYWNHHQVGHGTIGARPYVYTKPPTQRSVGPPSGDPPIRTAISWLDSSSSTYDLICWRSA